MYDDGVGCRDAAAEGGDGVGADRDERDVSLVSQRCCNMRRGCFSYGPHLNVADNDAYMARESATRLGPRLAGYCR